MQEEVEQKIALPVRTAHMTSIVLQQTLKNFSKVQKHIDKYTWQWYIDDKYTWQYIRRNYL